MVVSFFFCTTDFYYEALVAVGVVVVNENGKTQWTNEKPQNDL
jgi:hypothetical protein